MNDFSRNRASDPVSRSSSGTTCKKILRAVAHDDARTVRRLSDLLFELFADRGMIISTNEEYDDIWRLELLWPDEQDWAGIVAALQGAQEKPLPSFVMETIEMETIEMETIEADIAPVEIGRFAINGTGGQPEETSRITIRLDAALAFGDGHHPTTAGCLRALHTLLDTDRYTNILDLGCGSAILAIATAKATGSPVLASDVDPIAVRAALNNVRQNGVDALVHVIRADGFTHGRIISQAPFDLLFANILANPLMSLAKEMKRHMRPGGTAILSGFLPHQTQRIVAHYSSIGFTVERSELIEQWNTLILRT